MTFLHVNILNLTYQKIIIDEIKVFLYFFTKSQNQIPARLPKILKGELQRKNRKKNFASS